MAEIIRYAPVYIPTLNRYDHFKKCLDSLERCTGADKTDVYVGLDYPPSEKYVEGWKKIDAYLTEKEKSNGFSNLFVRRRDHNCGIGKPGSNVSLLCEEVKKVSDRYISSEDDNEFSPNFLVYMNTMLEIFKDDDRVFCVCGYNRNVAIPDYYKNNYYIARSYAAWGVGIWKNKRLPEKYSSFDYLKSLIVNDYTYQALKDRGPAFVGGLISMLKLQKLHGDMQIALYETLEYKYNICPTLSKVRNHGNDGTGLHSPIMIKAFSEFFEKQPIDDAIDFEPGNDTFVMNPDGIKIPQLPVTQSFVKRLIKKLIMQFDIFMLRKFHVVFHSKYI